MTEPRAIAAKALITDETILETPLILLEDGRIANITTQQAQEAPPGTLHLPESTLCAGFVDVHVHGAGGRDVMEGSSEAVCTVARVLASHGTTRYLATTVTAPVEHTLRSLDALATIIEAQPEAGCAQAVGIHLEGPFLSHAKHGVHEPELLQPPTIALFEQFWQASRGHIRLMTIAPELPGATDLITHATALGVRVSLGHSDALAAEARAGITAGGVSATHTFNAMRGLTQREPGMLGVVLDAAALYAELICDGIHTTPEAVRLWWRMKGPERGILITDGMAAMGMPDGDYQLGSMLVQVEKGVAMYKGVLAGSVLTLDRAVTNVRQFTGMDLATAVRLASRNPAAMLGLDNVKASADFNIYGPHGKLQSTMLRGQLLRAS